MSDRVILDVTYTPVASPRGLHKDVGDFMRYLQYRDHHEERGDADDVDGLLRYIAWRDTASPRGRLFDADATVGDRERQDLGAYIERSVAGTRQAGGPRSSTDNRACYRMVISPEDARGLDLRALTRTAMDQLGQDAGTGGLPRWIAAEHRNTRHPHVHVIMAARRETSLGRFRTLLITDPRLERMKETLEREILRQRGQRQQAHEAAARRVERMAAAPGREQQADRSTAERAAAPEARQPAQRANTEQPARSNPPASPDLPLGASAAARVARLAGRLARHYAREAEREAARGRDAGDRSRGGGGRERAA
jgi:hypothetical protein